MTFGCLNNFCKVNGAVLQLWKRVLDAVAGSRIILLTPPGSARDWARQTLGDRVEFVGRQSQEDYLRLYHRIDIGLDTFPYNGHMTSLDSAWMGVPVVTMAGKTAVGRGGVSILRNLGMAELIAGDEEEFVRIAVEMAGDLQRAASMRAAMRDRLVASPILDGVGFTRDFEGILRTVWGKWCEA